MFRKFKIEESVESQSHKQGVCVQQIQDRRVRGVEAVHCRVSKFYMR